MTANTLEARVERLETWAGPGQVKVLDERLTRVEYGVNDLRRSMGSLKRDVKSLKKDVEGLKTDVAGLKTDVAGLKTVQEQHTAMLNEILDRLPPRK
jgi:chromosome segregation ATPase